MCGRGLGLPFALGPMGGRPTPLIVDPSMTPPVAPPPRTNDPPPLSTLDVNEEDEDDDEEDEEGAPTSRREGLCCRYAAYSLAVSIGGPEG